MRWMVEVHPLNEKGHTTGDVFSRTFTKEDTAVRCYSRQRVSDAIGDVRLWQSESGKGNWNLVMKKGNN